MNVILSGTKWSRKIFLLHNLLINLWYKILRLHFVALGMTKTALI